MTSAMLDGARRMLDAVIGLARTGTAVLALGAMLLAAAAPANAQCREGGAATLPMPMVTWLRSYLVDFRSPTRLAVDGADNVFIADATRGSITARRFDGSLLADRRGLGNPVSVAVDLGGRVIVGDSGRGSVTAYDSTWSPLFQLGSGAGEFANPTDIVVDPANGEIFVSDATQNRVRVYSPLGAFLREIGAPAQNITVVAQAPAGVFRTPTGLALAGGELLVADQLDYRIQAFNKATGEFLYCVGNYRSGGFFSAAGGARARFFGMAQGLWVDTLGRAYLADSFEGVVRVVDLSNGGLIGTIGNFGTEAGALRVPTDMVIDRFSRMFVASADNGRIEVFGLDGYADPETRAPATLSLAPDVLDRLRPSPQVEVRLKVPGYRPAAIDRASLRINGLAPAAVVEGDRDGDGIAGLLLYVAGSELLAGMPGTGAGSAAVAASGNVGPLGFVATATLALTAIPPDSDGDGVPDAQDLCPGTPPGSAVDANGCVPLPPDSDGDGVIDALDRCPGTPRGAAVDASGCPVVFVDSDGDGIADAFDRCPGTRKGSKVNADGCAPEQLDSDGDGVSDADDLCPGTPPGSPVNARGCVVVGAVVTPSMALQGDRDKDGVPNSADRCPKTAKGTAVDANGCPVEDAAADADGDGVPDAKDQCPGTARGDPVDARGCSIEQACPCAAPRDGGSWRNHGQYRACVEQAVNDFRKAGLIDNGRDILFAASRSACGRTPRSRPPE